MVLVFDLVSICIGNLGNSNYNQSSTKKYILTGMELWTKYSIKLSCHIHLLEPLGSQVANPQIALFYSYFGLNVRAIGGEPMVLKQNKAQQFFENSLFVSD